MIKVSIFRVMQITVKRNNYCLVHGGGQKASTKQLQSHLANSEMLTAIKLPPDLGVCQTVIQSEFYAGGRRKTLTF